MIKRYRGDGEILKITSLTPTVKEVILKMPLDFTFAAGQYVTLALQNKEGKTISRPYSICSSPIEKGLVKLCIKIVAGGEFTSLLNHLTSKQKIKVVGPMGNFILAEQTLSRPKVFICTGTGISPLMSMLSTNIAKVPDLQVALLAGYRYQNEILYSEIWQTYQKKYPQFHYQVALTRPTANLKLSPFKNLIVQKGRIQTFFASKNLSLLYQNPKTLFYLCGLSQMINDSKKKLLAMGIKSANIHYEQYD